MGQYHLIASKGAGSMIVEAALALSTLPYEVEMIPYVEPGPQRERLVALNPLGQVPTLLLPPLTDVREERLALPTRLLGVPYTRSGPAGGGPRR